MDFVKKYAIVPVNNTIHSFRTMCLLIKQIERIELIFYSSLEQDLIKAKPCYNSVIVMVPETMRGSCVLSYLEGRPCCLCVFWLCSVCFIPWM